MAKSETALSPADFQRAAIHGLSGDEVGRQLEILQNPPPQVALDRPCTIDDGIARIPDDEVPALLEAHAKAAAAGRATYFVPASGAATRMFKSLLATRADGPVDRAKLAAAGDDGDAATALRFFDGLQRFAFTQELGAVLTARGSDLGDCLQRGSVGPVLDALLDPTGLAYADTPKGLLLFHRYPDAGRTAFEEHLVESAALARADDGATRLHFTVSPAHEEAFAKRLASARAALETRLDAQFQVSFSTQKNSTDTVAVDLDGEPFRDTSGALLFRPGGHGSLIANLDDLAAAGADLIYVKNIDNVVHDDWRAPIVQWRRLLAGRLVVVQQRLFAALRAMDDAANGPEAVAAAGAVLREELGTEPPAVRAPAGAAEAVRRLLDRPVRVCAVLRAEGDPGGGPFWVRDEDGSLSPQIVETAQIDQTSTSQREIQGRATHFSPADMVLGVRNHRGEAFDLQAHVDPGAVFIAEKSNAGRALRALEHPGLWNGGMADWNTLFVEVPPAIFHPVKALTDLLDPAHQPSGESG